MGLLNRVRSLEKRSWDHWLLNSSHLREHGP